jgi:hypothetical protein
MARETTKGLVAGVKIHRKGDRLNSAEHGTVLRIEEHVSRGTIVWYRPDTKWIERPAPLEQIRIIRKVKVKQSMLIIEGEE